MKNAAITSFEEAEKAMRENALEIRIRAFTKDFAPEDRDDAAEFSYRLIDIVRAIYSDAQEKPHAQMMAMMNALPNPFLTTTSRQKGDCIEGIQ